MTGPFLHLLIVAAAAAAAALLGLEAWHAIAATLAGLA